MHTIAMSSGHGFSSLYLWAAKTNLGQTSMLARTTKTPALLFVDSFQIGCV